MYFRRLIGRLIDAIVPRGMANKLFVAICIIGALLIFSLVFIVTIISQNLLYYNAKMLLDNQAKQIVNTFDQYMEILRNTVMTTSRQNSIKSLIFKTYSEYGSYLVYRDAYAYLKNIHEFYDWIHVYIVVKDINYIMSSNPADVTGNYSKKGVTNQKWYKQLEESPIELLPLSNFIPPVSSKEEHFAYALRVRDVYKWKMYGYVIASIDKSVIGEMLKGTSFKEKGFVLVLRQDGDIAYCSRPFIYNTSRKGNFWSQLSNKGVISIKGKGEYYYSSWNSRLTGWKFITFTDKAYADKQILNFQLSVGIIAVSTVMLLIVMAKLTARTYIKPINRLIDFIHEIERKEFAGQISLEAKDELGDLIRSFNAMIASVRQNQILRKKAQIYVLQKQIDPHFLFNTLASIKALAQQNDAKGVVSMIEKLSDIFYYNINPSGSSMTKVRNEIAHIQNYLDIQRVRFGDRIKVVYEIDERVLDYSMPHIILQPIVENSITHSMENMKTGYQLEIKVGFEEEDIVFVIRDNGKGIPADKLDRLRQYIYDTDGKVKTDEFGIGLKNIQERLFLLYGEGYGLTINSIFGEYTEVRIRIPKSEKGEDITYVNGADR
ncbi:two-component system sensor histidine kinase YesM [Caldicoprobacter guelmensis]|uniref:cache domain-containing sensor histidine kinase n=1 Tax=Caldicoprobacter guelmensis TaxID=1170224 RepID=UPI0019577BDA|nr:histidine kinase [Caldicoprobacter guelmensis]MBM7582519.1 two-component system sensor histidine kinase YesM [Caldicoprobacter guelmensis]